MRLPWFSASSSRRRRAGRGRRHSSTPLRVRQLERRRVLDAALQSLVVTPTPTVSEEPITTPTVSGDEPLVFDWSAYDSGTDSAAATAAFIESSQGGSGSLSGTFDPVVFLTPPDVLNVNEGDLLNYDGTTGPALGFIQDFDDEDLHAAVVNWGDGGGYQTLDIFTGDPIIRPFGGPNGQHTYADGDSTPTEYTVIVRVADNHMPAYSDPSLFEVDGQNGNYYVEESFVVKVHNVAPELSDPADVTIQENGTAVLTTTLTDPGTQDVFSVEVDWKEGAPADTITGLTFSADDTDTVGGTTYTWTAATRQLVVSHQYLDDNPTDSPSDPYVVTFIPRDNDSGTGDTQSATVTVENATPAVALGTVATIQEDGTAELSGTITDDGTLDTFTLDINWGDSLSPDNVQQFALGTTALTIAADGIDWDPTTRIFTVRHQYLDDNPTNTDSDDYTISVKVTDDDTEFVEDTRTVTVENATPAVALGTVATIQEDGTAELSGTITDDGTLDTFTLDINWGDSLSPDNVQQFALGTTALTIAADGIDWDPTTRIFTVRHQYLDDNPTNTDSDDYTISVKVTDDDTEFVEDTRTVTVENATPAVALGTVATIQEDGTAELSGTITDDGTLDTFTLDINWGDSLSPDNVQQFALGTTALTIAADGIDWDPTTRIFTVRHQYLDDNPTNTDSDDYTISVKVTDDDTEFVEDTRTVTVENATPAVALGTVATIQEDGTAELSGTITDDGTLDTFTLDINWGDSLSPDNVQQFALGTTALTIAADGIDWDPTTRIFTVRHQYLDDNPTNTDSDDYTISVKVTDDDTEFVEDTRTVTVENATPAVALGTVATIQEDGTAELSGTITDDGTLDTFTLDINWGDSLSPDNVQQFALGTTALTIAADGIDWDPTTRIFTVRHQYLDDNPTNTDSDDYTISVKVTDDDTEFVEDTRTVTVENATPAVALGTVATIQEDGTAELSGTITDDGTLDTFTLDINWGDSLSPDNVQQFALGTTALTIAADGIDWDPTTRIFTVRHQYLDDNPTNTDSDDYTISVKVTDDDTEFVEDTRTVTVENATPAVALGTVATIQEDGTAELSGTITDDGTLDTFTLDINWGDSLSPDNVQQFALGTTALTIAADGIDWDPTTRIFTVRHQYLDDNPTNTDSDDYTISVKVTDDDTEFVEDTRTVTVENATPAVALGTVATIQEDGTAELSGTITDDGTLDTFTLDINWGDSLSPDNVQQFALGTTALTIAADGIDWDPTTRIFTVRHQYLDDNPTNTDSDDYTISVKVTDDDTEFVEDTRTVTVENVTPQFINPDPDEILENSQATISAIIDDPGTLDVFSVVVNWQDGSGSDTINGLGLANIPTTTIGGTTYTWDGDSRLLTLSHHYNDDNPTGTPSDTFPVSLVVTDDDTESSTSSINVVVNNDLPVVQAVNVSDLDLTINESESLSITGSFTDRLIDFSTESFRAFVIWGDGNFEELTVSSPAGLQRTLASTTHTYIDNDADNLFTIRVRVADDDMAAFAAPDLFVNGSTVAGDFVEFTVDVTVLNVNPTLQPLSATNVESTGRATVSLSFSDPGADTFEVLVNWGDNLGFVTEVVNVAAAPTGTPLSFTLEHFYTGPPDPLNPTADITITVQIHDDDAAVSGVVQAGISNLESIAISNPGIDTVNVAIDTTPQVPRLEFTVVAPVQILLDQQSSSIQSVQSTDSRIVRAEVRVNVERFLVLVVISPEDMETETHRIDNAVLSNLRELFATLPDGHYKIFLVRSDNNTRRLVIEVYVRRGRVIDPSDDSEGTRDRPPTEESPQAVPLNENPLLGPEINNGQPDAAMQPNERSDGDPLADDAITLPTDDSYAITATSLRWAAPLAGLAFVAGRARWSQEVEAVLQQADDQAWHRLRRAGRLGGRRSRAGRGQATLKSN